VRSLRIGARGRSVVADLGSRRWPSHSRCRRRTGAKPSVNSARPPNRIVAFCHCRTPNSASALRRTGGPRLVFHVAPSHSQVSRAHCPSTPSHEADRRTAPAVHGSGRTRWRVSVRSEGPMSFDLRPLRAVEHPSVSKRLFPQRVRHRTARCNCVPCRKSSSVRFACRAESRDLRQYLPSHDTCPWGPRSPEEVGQLSNRVVGEPEIRPRGWPDVLVSGPQTDAPHRE